ncbi:MAG TPA: tRNA (uridine(34)/cytosine(34)/5-carboxymethylaminomethyluridine(34)-2'-O)-methyltransferase TrmL [Burkholderiales bacterium]|jgi:tRNA (cytidine/uridine-2'-O-)-methyltransferase|nr:tRNA (uridine(34)/cytosine(34)/5-carboxymethylaminomethyluridine(34)-2'-O)-methyltransferase TrmL [Burkholderiales bacterium]
MFDIVLYQPEIPPNTGNVIRLCANTGCRLHLIEPLGFRLEDRHLKRAGLDYHEYARVRVHPGWQAFLVALPSSRRFAFSTKAANRYDQVGFQAGDVLVFGPETSGLPEEVRESFEPQRRLRLPMVPASRSLNLSNAVAAVVYEAWRQNGFMGAGG